MSDTPIIEVFALPSGNEWKYGAKLPTRAYLNDSGWDLYALQTINIRTGGVRTVRTGISIKLPPGFEAQVRPRSGLTSEGLIVILGTIDNGYTGEIKVNILNATGESAIVAQGTKIAQLVPQRLAIYEMQNCDGGETARENKGFGSSG